MVLLPVLNQILADNSVWLESLFLVCVLIQIFTLLVDYLTQAGRRYYLPRIINKMWPIWLWYNWVVRGFNVFSALTLLLLVPLIVLGNHWGTNGWRLAAFLLIFASLLSIVSMSLYLERIQKRMVIPFWLRIVKF